MIITFFSSYRILQLLFVHFQLRMRQKVADFAAVDFEAGEVTGRQGHTDQGHTDQGPTDQVARIEGRIRSYVLVYHIIFRTFLHIGKFRHAYLGVQAYG